MLSRHFYLVFFMLPQPTSSPNKPEQHSCPRKPGCDDDVNPKIRGYGQVIAMLRIGEEIGPKQCLSLTQLRFSYGDCGTLTAKKVAGRKMAEISAIVIIDLVSRADCSVSLFMSLFSLMPCSVSSCILKLICLLASAARVSCMFCTYARFC